MLIRPATQADIAPWCALATEVSDIFQHPRDMGADKEFIAYVQNKVSKQEALTAVDDTSGENMGFVGFSRGKNRISWLAVSGKYRGKGAGDRLIKAALRQLDTDREITLSTFLSDYMPGLAARALYEKYGFEESGLTEYNGHSGCVMTRLPTVGEGKS